MKIELNETEIDSIVLALDQRTEYLQEMFKNERDQVLKTLTKDYQDLKKKILETKEWKVKQWNAQTQIVNTYGYQRKKNQYPAQNADNT